jgi:RimJ/RimL family protein N-acetyltransferase
LDSILAAVEMLTLRPATLDDAKPLFDWRNDEQTRAASVDTAALKWESHLAWLARTLGDPMRRLWIAELDGSAVGTVRLDTAADGVGLMSWTVAPAARGQGVATEMVRMAADEAARRQPLRAEIKAGNTASIKVAEAAGFACVDSPTALLRFERARLG